MELSGQRTRESEASKRKRLDKWNTLKSKLPRLRRQLEMLVFGVSQGGGGGGGGGGGWGGGGGGGGGAGGEDPQPV